MKTTYSHTDGAVTMSQEEVMLASLTGNLPTPVAPMPTGAIDKVTRSRIRYGVSELVHGNIENVQRWLSQVADGVIDPVTQQYVKQPNPKEAIELFIELLQFSVPKMKAVAVEVKDKGGNMQRLSISDLQSIVSEQ